MDGKQATRHLRDSQPIDLLFTDVVLPGGMSGAEIAAEAKRLQPGIKVLLTTGYAANAVVNDGDLAPGAMILNKPYLSTTLLEKVRDTLDG